MRGVWRSRVGCGIGESITKLVVARLSRVGVAKRGVALLRGMGGIPKLR
jgi:hypothetical protein